MKKKSLKKVTSAVLVAAMSMGLLAGCGGSKSSGEAKTDADGATVIKFGIHVANPKKQETVTYNIVQGFNKENKGKYKVEFVAADTEAHSKNMKLAAQDGSLPEIVHLDSAEAPKYNEAGYLLDMSDFLIKTLMMHWMVWKMHSMMEKYSMDFHIKVMFRDFSIIKICLIKLGLLIQQMIQLMTNSLI